jgi:hypothetical protein
MVSTRRKPHGRLDYWAQKLAVEVLNIWTSIESDDLIVVNRIMNQWEW